METTENESVTIPLKMIACSRLSISGSKRKQRRAKNQAIQGRRTDQLTEGLEKAIKMTAGKYCNTVTFIGFLSINHWQILA